MCIISVNTLLKLVLNSPIDSADSGGFDDEFSTNFEGLHDIGCGLIATYLDRQYLNR
jgi:hypothetical protein